MKTATDNKLTTEQIAGLTAAVTKYIDGLQTDDRVSICCYYTGQRFVCGREWPNWRNGTSFPTAMTSCTQRSAASTVTARLVWDFEESN